MFGKLTEKQRKEFYKYCIKTGFIIKSADDWSDDKKYKKIKQYMRKGYRVVNYGDAIEVINIFGEKIPDNIRSNIENISLWLME